MARSTARTAFWPGGGRDAPHPTPPWHWILFVASGAVFIVAGGFAAAANGVTPSPHLSWASAFLVLVCGSAQIVLGGGQVLVVSSPPRACLVVLQFAAFNLANAAVLAGTLSRVAGVLDAGSVLFLVAIGLFAWATREAGLRDCSVTLLYRAALLVLAVSATIGVRLAR
jgi:hypothetical protein